MYGRKGLRRRRRRRKVQEEAEEERKFGQGYTRQRDKLLRRKKGDRKGVINVILLRKVEEKIRKTRKGN